MAVVINTNVDALKIQGLLNNSTNKMSSSMQKMSSGLKITSAKDDAAGTVISAKMQVQLNGNQIAQKNVQNANALLSTVEGNLDVVEDNLAIIIDLTLQDKNGTYSSSEIEAMQDEVDERVAEINRISKSAKYSSLGLFGGDLGTSGMTFQVGSDAGVDNTIKAEGALFKTVEFSTLTGTAGKKFDLTSLTNGTSVTFTSTEASAETGDTDFDVAIRALDAAINDITERKSIIGSAGNRMDSALSTLSTQYENLSSAKSIITDADVAAEASNFTQQQILQQVSTSLLAQANQAPSIALSLI